MDTASSPHPDARCLDRRVCRRPRSSASSARPRWPCTLAPSAPHPLPAAATPPSSAPPLRRQPTLETPRRWHGCSATRSSRPTRRGWCGWRRRHRWMAPRLRSGRCRGVGSARREVGWHREGGEGSGRWGGPTPGPSVERFEAPVAAVGGRGERLPPLTPCLALLRSHRPRVDRCATRSRWSWLWLGGAGQPPARALSSDLPGGISPRRFVSPACAGYPHRVCAASPATTGQRSAAVCRHPQVCYTQRWPPTLLPTDCMGCDRRGIWARDWGGAEPCKLRRRWRRAGLPGGG